MTETDGGNIRLVSLAAMAMRNRWRYEAMRTVSDHLLVWFTRGQGRITVSGVTRGYGAHNAVFIPAGTMHSFELGRQVLGTAIYFSRHLDLDLPETAVHLRITEAAAQGRLTAHIDAIRLELEEQKPAFERAALHHAGLISVWLDRQPQTAFIKEADQDAGSALAARFAELVERDYKSGRQVADYAAALGVTPTHLSRVCKAACGRNASALLAERVTSEARRLLRDEKRPIGEIAQELGFSSQAYFSRAFQIQTGQSPSAFRRGR